MSTPPPVSPVVISECKEEFARLLKIADSFGTQDRLDYMCFLAQMLQWQHYESLNMVDARIEIWNPELPKELHDLSIQVK